MVALQGRELALIDCLSSALEPLMGEGKNQFSNVSLGSLCGCHGLCVCTSALDKQMSLNI